jgi:hypothetical protein
MNLRYDCLPGEWQDELPTIEPWPDDHTSTEDRPMPRNQRACIICGATRDLERAGEQAAPGGRGYLPTYGCRDVNACDRRFDALLRKTQTPRTAQLGGTTVRGA